MSTMRTIFDNAVREKTGGLPIISLDPLMEQGVDTFAISRGYYAGGIQDFGQVARPGFASLADQAGGFTSLFASGPICVVEDDIFSGGSVIGSVEALIAAGAHIQSVVTGVQVGKPKKLEAMGIPVVSVVQYETDDGRDIFDVVDLGDPRDYLVGASGLVTKLPNGEYGRAPYILPLVSAAARASIPTAQEWRFSQDVLHANMEFFLQVERQIGTPLLLGHMNPACVRLFHDVYGIDIHTPMTMIVNWMMEHMDEIWHTTHELGKLHESLDALGLPKHIVFLDVNGTILDESATDSTVDVVAADSLIHTVLALQDGGIAVGLHSDSPHAQLEKFARDLGLGDVPIISENGAVLTYKEKTVVLTPLTAKETQMANISRIASELGYTHVSDVVAVEFGGTPVSYGDWEWAFGANREESISVFGPVELIRHLGDHFGGAADSSPEYNYLGVHATDSKKGKAIALKLLKGFGYDVHMVGNSMSDWIDPESAVPCSFVGGARITSEVASQATYVSDLPTIWGVIDCLSKKGALS